jgi:hypothetical protein
LGWDRDLAAEILYKFPKVIRAVFSHESSRPQPKNTITSP